MALILPFIFIKISGGEPDLNQKNIIKTMKQLKREDADNRLVVGEYILHYLQEDKFCREIKSDYMQQWGSIGFIETYSHIFFKNEPRIKDVVPWFMDIVFGEISYHKDRDESEFLKAIENIKKIDGVQLEIMYRITERNNIQPDELKDLNALKNNLNNEDFTAYAFAMFSSGVLHSEAIILNQVYKDWFNK